MIPLFQSCETLQRNYVTRPLCTLDTLNWEIKHFPYSRMLSLWWYAMAVMKNSTEVRHISSLIYPVQNLVYSNLKPDSSPVFLVTKDIIIHIFTWVLNIRAFLDFFLEIHPHPPFFKYLWVFPAFLYLIPSPLGAWSQPSLNHHLSQQKFWNRLYSFIFLNRIIFTG